MLDSDTKSGEKQDDAAISGIMKDTLDLLNQPLPNWQTQKNENAEEGEPKIAVNDVVSRLAFLYEKIRNTVDYKEEHLLRKNAIKRVLKRILIIENRKKERGKYLIKELIRARYLPNNTIPETEAEQVSRIIEKHLALHHFTVSLQKDNGSLKNGGSSSSWLDWILGVVACQIDERFFPRFKEEAVVNLMQYSMRKKISFSEELIDQDEVDLHLNIAVRRTFIKADQDLLNYFILKIHYSQWFTDGYNEELTIKIADEIYLLRESIQEKIDHPMQGYLYQICKKNLASFLIFEDIFKFSVDKVKGLFKDKEALEQKIREFAKARYQGVSEKLQRSAVRSVLYIFVTKVGVALALELPYELYFLKELNYLTLGINILFPPLLMFLLVLNVKAPSEKNTQKIIWEIMGVISNKNGTKKEEEKNTYIIKPSVIKNESFFDNVFQSFYTIMLLAPLAVVMWLLVRLEFNLVGGVIFIFYLSAISFFATRLRLIAKELLVVDSKEGIFAIIQDFFLLPFIRLGQWISLKFSKINVLVFVLDFIIEAPFKTLIEIFEQWVSFLRKKREEIY